MHNALIVAAAVIGWAIILIAVYLFTLALIAMRPRIDYILFLNNTIIKVKSMSQVNVKVSQLTKLEDGSLVVEGRILPKNVKGEAASVADVAYASSDENTATVKPHDDNALLFTVTYLKPGVVTIGVGAKSKGGADLEDSIEITFVDDTEVPPVDDEAVTLNAELILPSEEA